MNVTVVSIPGGRLLRNMIQKLVPRYDKCLNLTLVVSVPINLSIKLDFVSVNDPREIYFVDVIRYFYIMSKL